MAARIDGIDEPTPSEKKRGEAKFGWSEEDVIISPPDGEESANEGDTNP